MRRSFSERNPQASPEGPRAELGERLPILVQGIRALECTTRLQDLAVFTFIIRYCRNNHRQHGIGEGRGGSWWVVVVVVAMPLTDYHESCKLEPPMCLAS